MEGPKSAALQRDAHSKKYIEDIQMIYVKYVFYFTSEVDNTYIS